ncbi:MAG: hypothetical protein KA118_16755, partial [Verrucomicrobia bacterium]|nr:hypothetical protein [Verrucomicrobiota bacterium]
KSPSPLRSAADSQPAARLLYPPPHYLHFQTAIFTPCLRRRQHRDLYAADPFAIGQARVVLTVLDGTIVHDSDRQNP